MLRRSYCIFVAQGIKRRFPDSLNSYSNAYLFTDSEKPPLTPLCIEDAERVEDPILFERPCKCIADARSLVLRIDLPSASQRNFNKLANSCLAVKVPLRGTFVQLCVFSKKWSLCCCSYLNLQMCRVGWNIVVNVHYLSAMENNNSDKPKCVTPPCANQRDFQSMRNRVVLHIQETPTLEFCSMLSWSRTRLRK